MQMSTKPGIVLLSSILLVAMMAAPAMGELENVASQPPESGQEDAAATDPARLGWMVGNPPPPERLIRYADGSHYRFPQWRWSFSNMRTLMPSAPMNRNGSAVVPLPDNRQDALGAVRFAPMGDEAEMSWDEALGVTYTDAIVVLHQGAIVYERYLGVAGPHTPHIAFSVTKSYIGTLVESMIATGEIDPDKTVAQYIPELARSGFATATIRNLLDMTTAIDYSEIYNDPESDVSAFAIAGSFFPRPPDYRGPLSYYEFLTTIAPLGVHGEVFSYKSVNTEVLSWIVGRVTGKRPHTVLGERIWHPLGVEGSAYFLIDSTGAPFTAGGLNATVRDHARFGEMLRNNGRFNGRQVIPEQAVRRIRAGGDPVRFAAAGYDWLAGWSYSSQWWHTGNSHGAFVARGIHGQAIYIDPVAEMVIVRSGSHPVASNAATDRIWLPAFAAMARELMKE